MADEPTDAEVIRTAIDSRLLSLHTSMPGVVVTYNPGLQTADVQPVIKRAVPTSDGGIEHETLPVIHNVPVEWPGGGGFAMQFPVRPGDHVWLIFSEAATAKWRSTGQISEPGDLRRHDLSYAMALFVRGPMKNALAPLTPPTEARMDCPAPFVFGNQMTAQLVALSGKVDAAMELIKAHVHPTAMGPSGTAATLEAIESTAGTSLKSD
jgi:Phage protein Gp138 N-terminal domain